MRFHRRSKLAGGAIIAAATALTLVAVSSGAAATASTHRSAAVVRPSGLIRHGAGPLAVNYPVTAFTQEFNLNTNLFCPAAATVPNGPNQPCDGNWTVLPYSDYGTIDRVASGFNNGGYGNYAPETKSLIGTEMAVVSGDDDVNQGAGCAQPLVVELCTGPYALFGANAASGQENVFPHAGFTVTDDLYLSPTTTNVAGTLVDDDVELNTNAGGYGTDDVISACYGSGGFGLTFDGHGSPG